MSGVLNSPLAIMRIDGWSVATDSDEPRIRDLELGARLGFARPAKIRDLIKRLARLGKLNDVRCVPTVGKQQTGLGRTRELVVTEFWLTQYQALLVIAKSETEIADQILDEVIRVFIAYHRGQLVAAQPAPQPVPIPVAQNSLTLGDVYRDDIERRCRITAKSIGRSVHLVHGCLRMFYDASGVYKISAAHYAAVLRVLDMLALGEIELPATKRPPRLKLVADPRQQVIPFPDARASKPAPETPA